MAKWDKPGSGQGPISVIIPTGVLAIAPIYGSNVWSAGVRGDSNTGPGVLGMSIAHTKNDPPMPGSGHSDGVQGESDGNGVHGISHSSTDSGVWGENKGGGVGVSGSTSGQSSTSNGVQGTSASPMASGVWGNNTGGGVGVSGSSATGIGVYAKGSNLAAQFDGTVQANGDINVTGDVTFVNAIGGDCAEDFDIEDGEETITPGTVLVIGDHGKLTVAREAYDSRIAGVVSGAGSLRPAILLNRVSSTQRRMPIALIGRAYCKVDATFAKIRPGDLLTTSPTPGHAMKVLDRANTVGALLGKALEGLENGRGLIPILVSPR